MLDAMFAPQGGQLFGIIHQAAVDRYGTALIRIETEIVHTGSHRIRIFYGHGAGVRYVEGYLDHAYLARYSRDELPAVIEEWARGLVSV